MNKQITIRDVARKAGVSRQTVSRAFNNKGEISEGTKQHVLDVARQMGYRPSGVARSLVTNRTFSVGLLIPDIALHFFSLIVRGAEAAASAAGYSMYLVNTLKNQQLEAKALDSLWDRRIDGAILYASFLTPEQLEEYVERFQYTVFINCNAVPRIVGKTATINIDDQEGARLAVAHLQKNGHKKIALISGPSISISGQRRLQGFKDAHTEFGLPIDPSLIIGFTGDQQQFRQEISHLLTENSGVTAILAHNDDMAIGTMQIAEELGKRIPEDIEIIGFDDIPLASIIKPNLTTLRIGKQDLGALAMKTLITMIEGKIDEYAADKIIIPQLLVRESSP